MNGQWDHKVEVGFYYDGVAVRTYTSLGDVGDNIDYGVHSTCPGTGSNVGSNPDNSCIVIG